MTNWEVAQIFIEIAELLEILGENLFKSRAYRKAARVLLNTPQDVKQLVQEGGLEEIPGIGAALSAKIKELVATGELGYYRELKENVPSGLREMLRIPGVGVKTVQALYSRLRVTSLAELEAAAREQRLRELPGIGKKTEEAILRGIESLAAREKRWLLNYASAVAGTVRSYLAGLEEVVQAEVAGSFRRGRETVGDLDFVAASEEPSRVIRKFVQASWVEDVVAEGESKATVITRWGIQADLLVLKPFLFISALQHFTGSPEHNRVLRERAHRLGRKISEYGIIDREGKPYYPETEQDFYRQIGMAYIAPELREDGGEIEAALEGTLPRLVDQEEIKGDLHVHSSWSDGVNSLAELAAAAKERGYSYLAVTDHTKSLSVANGLIEERLLRQRNEIACLNRELEGVQLLAGIELEILPDKSLDFDDRVLSEMDIVIASIHSGFKQNPETLTDRVVAALKNEHVDIIAHPTGRLLGRREPYPLDVSRILEVAAQTGTALEINASPDRLDLKDVFIKEGKKLGVRFAINSDAHNVHYLDDMRYGVVTARRGWLESEDIINTMPLPELKKWLRKKQR